MKSCDTCDHVKKQKAIRIDWDERGAYVEVEFHDCKIVFCEHPDYYGIIQEFPTECKGWEQQ